MGDTTLFVDTSVQDDFDDRNYGQLATGKRLDPGSTTRYACAGGEALVKCENSGVPKVEGVFAMPCMLPVRLCGCCATVGNIPVSSAIAISSRYLPYLVFFLGFYIGIVASGAAAGGDVWALLS